MLRLPDGKIPFLTSQMLSIPSPAPNKELAWEFIRYVLEGGMLAVPVLSKKAGVGSSVKTIKPLCFEGW